MKLSLKMFFGICIPAVISCLVIAAFLIEKNLDEYKNVNLPFEETSKYLEKVISSYKIYVKLYS